MIEEDKVKEVLKSLPKLSANTGLPVNKLRVIIALERLVARLEAHSELKDKLIFKGGFVLLKTLQSPRFTRDLDANAFGISKVDILKSIKEALANNLRDGIYFATPEFEDLIQQGEQGGIRVKVPFQIGNLPLKLNKIKKLSKLHLDISFNDKPSKHVKRDNLQSLIKNEEISWKIYSVEVIFAEKLQTLVIRGAGNSRGKDVFDLITIYSKPHNSDTLRLEIKETFKNRSTTIPKSLVDFVSNMDLTILMRSWGSVELQGSNLTFKDCMKKLKEILINIDLLLK